MSDYRLVEQLTESTGTSTGSTGISGYQANNIDEKITTANVVYIGMENAEGDWCIKKIDETIEAQPIYSYATVVNNPTITDYTTAWAAIATLVYNNYSVAF